MYRPDRSPARPALFPATDKSWQGLPPIITSTTGASAPLIFVISPRCIIAYPSFCLYLNSLTTPFHSTVAASMLLFQRVRRLPGHTKGFGHVSIRPPPNRHRSWHFSAYALLGDRFFFLRFCFVGRHSLHIISSSGLYRRVSKSEFGIYPDSS